MYDAMQRDSLIKEGWIQTIGPDEIKESEDLFPFALDGLRVNDQLFGIPVFLCGNFLIYDQNEKELADAEHITDLKDDSRIPVMNSDNPLNRPQYILEVIADLKGEANPSMDESAEEIMDLIDRLAVDSCKNYDDPSVAQAYDSGISKGYIGFSESMCLLKKRADTTTIKAISFADKENIPRLYTDAAAITSNVKGRCYDKMCKTDQHHGGCGSTECIVSAERLCAVSYAGKEKSVSETD